MTSEEIREEVPLRTWGDSLLSSVRESLSPRAGSIEGCGITSFIVQRALNLLGSRGDGKGQRIEKAEIWMRGTGSWAVPTKAFRIMRA